MTKIKTLVLGAAMLLFSIELSIETAATFYEKGRRVKTESSQWLPAWKRLILLSAAQQTEHGFGSRGGIFSGSRVNGPNGRLMLVGLYPLHDAGTIFYTFSQSSGFM